jgi:peptide/nickel transport system permease protein
MVRLLPGDPAVAIGGPQASAQELDAIRKELGLDQPWPTQFARYVSDIAQGDLGRSYSTRQPVRDLLGDRVGPSIQLAGVALLVVLATSVPLGMFAAHMTREGRHPRIETAWTSVTAALGAIPSFMVAMLLIFVFAVTLNLLPVAGTEGWYSLILPVASVALAPTLILARIVRLQTLDALAQDYIRTARSKRLPWRTIYLRHIMPNVVPVALTVGGLLLASLIAGAIFVEQIFVRLGMGAMLVNAVLNHDYPVVQASVLVFGVTVVVANATVDVAVSLLDPRSLTADV